MLDELEFAPIRHSYDEISKQNIQLPPPAMYPSAPSSKQILFWPLQEVYQKITGTKFDGDDPSVIVHYRLADFGQPCPYCEVRLRTTMASQCIECGMDWHNRNNVVSHRKNRLMNGYKTPDS